MSRKRPIQDFEQLLTPGEVAAIFSVDPRTVTRWEKSGKLKATRTLGGHRRFSKTEVEKALQNGSQN